MEKNVELNQGDNLTQEEKVQKAIDIIKSKESTFYFMVSETPNPAASVYEIYFHANVVKNLGYNVKMLTVDPEYKIPFYIDSELTDMEHISSETVKLQVTPSDVVVIPEIMSFAMEQTKNLPCLRVVLLQSIDYALQGLQHGVNWSSQFGISKVITTSNMLKNAFEEYYGKGIYDIKTYKMGIPDYFSYDEEKDPLKQPIISIVGRNANELHKLPNYSMQNILNMLG